MIEHLVGRSESEGGADRANKFSGLAKLLIGSTVVLAICTVWVGAQKDPNRFAASILQGVTLVVGLVGSFIAGRDASREAAQEVIRPHARSAFRRVKNLYAALGRQREAIASQRQFLEAVCVDSGGTDVPIAHVLASFGALDLMVVEQISTADDALEDWRDLVPEEVAAIEAAGQLREQENDVVDGNA